MTDENLLTSKDKKKIMDESKEAIEIVQNTLGDFFDTASVDAAYGAPIKDGDTLLIPTAEVLSVMGFGVGAGYGSGNVESEEEESPEAGVGEGGGGGGGGGGKVLSRPVAVIISSNGSVRVEPIFDITKIALAALTAAGFMVGMLARMLQPRKF